MSTTSTTVARTRKTLDLEHRIEERIPEGVRETFSNLQISGREIIRALGEGSEGYTLLVKGLEGEPEVVAAKITTVRATLDGDCSEAEREARILQGLSRNGNQANGHPDIPTYYGHFKLPGRLHVIIREAVEGISVKDDLSLRTEEGTAYEAQEVYDVLLSSMQGLKHAHDATKHPALGAVIHRDIKPSNMILVRPGIARLVDYGVAKPMSETLTAAATTVGTFNYMAPEQFGRLDEIGPWTDVYGLSMVATEMILGKIPKAVLNTRFGHTNVSLPESIPSEMRKVLEKGLQPEHEKRYQNLEEFESALNAARRIDRRELERILEDDAGKVGEAHKFVIKELGEMGRLGLGVALISLAGSAGLFINGNYLYAGIAGMTTVGFSLGSMLFRSERVRLKKELKQIEGQLQKQLEVRVEELAVQPRGRLGRVYDNLLRRDTPHRAYFRALKTLEGRTKTGEEFGLEAEINETRTLARNAGYNELNFDYARLRTTHAENVFRKTVEIIGKNLKLNLNELKEKDFDQELKNKYLRRAIAICEQNERTFSVGIQTFVEETYYQSPLKRYLERQLDIYEHWVSDGYEPPALDSALERIHNLTTIGNFNWDSEREKNMKKMCVKNLPKYVESKLKFFEHWARDGDQDIREFLSGWKSLSQKYGLSWNSEREKRIIQIYEIHKKK